MKKWNEMPHNQRSPVLRPIIVTGILGHEVIQTQRKNNFSLQDSIRNKINYHTIKQNVLSVSVSVFTPSKHVEKSSDWYEHQHDIENIYLAHVTLCFDNLWQLLWTISHLSSLPLQSSHSFLLPLVPHNAPSSIWNVV